MTDPDRLWAQVDRGSRRALARAFTVLERGEPAALARLVRLAHPHSDRAHVVGITGAPGAGKSTLTAAIVGELRRRGRRVGVIAVDPSSPFTGGAVLGDRVRMLEHAEDPGVFIRSMAARGRLGGLAAATGCGVVLLAGAGYDTVLVETVGVGQSEVALASAADTVVLTVVPGLGDAVQADKAGIMEIADIFVVNKADRDGAGQTESQLSAAIRLAPPGPWRPPVHRTVAVRGDGVPATVDSITDHHAALVATGGLLARRTARARQLIEDIVLGRLRDDRHADDGPIAALAARVARHELDPFTAADHLMPPPLSS